MRLKGIIGFIAVMLLFMPYSYAFSWQEDIDAATVDPIKTYEVYRGMSMEELRTAWGNVPGWHVETWEKQDEESSVDYSAIFQKDGRTPDKVREVFVVDYTKEYGIVGSHIHFFTTDIKTAHKIVDYAGKRINRLTKHAGSWHTTQAYGGEYTSSSWGGKWNGAQYHMNLTLLYTTFKYNNKREYCVVIAK